MKGSDKALNSLSCHSCTIEPSAFDFIFIWKSFENQIF